MKKLILAFIIIFLPFYSAKSMNVKSDQLKDSQKLVTGLVLSKEGKPLAGASVVVSGTAIGAGTNAKGVFSLIIDKDEETTLKITYVGYKPKEYKLTKAETKIKVELEESSYYLDEIVVTGSRVETPLKDAPIITRMISEKDIYKINPMDVTTLLQFELPGMQFGRHHGSGLPTMNYQGTEGNYMLFLIDGERLSGEGAADNVDFTRFNIDEIERVEVVKGSMSTLYGSNALGGVINIITKDANRPFTANVSSRVSSIGEQKYSVSGGTKQNRFSSLSSVSYRRKNPFTVSDKEKAMTITTKPTGELDTSYYKASSVDIKGYNLWDFSQKFKYTFTENLFVQVKGSYYNNRRLNNEPDAKFEDVYSDFSVNAKATYLMSCEHFLSFSYNFDHFTKDYDFKQTNYLMEIYKDITNTAHLNYVGTLNNHNILTAGLEANTETLRHYMFADTGLHSNQYYVFYLQNEGKYWDNFSLVPGLRFDYHSEYKLHITPRISAMYKYSDFTFRAGYASGFRSPSLKELYSDYNMGGLGIFQIKGNPDLKPETSNQFSLSAELSDGILNASVSAYHNFFNDKIGMEWRTDSTGYPNYTFVNAEQAQTSGIEGILKLKFDFGLSMQASYSFVRDYQSVNGLNTSSMRPHNATCNISYSRLLSNTEASISMNGYWMSGVDTYSYLDKGYSKISFEPRYLCSMHFGAKFPMGIRVNIGIDNLFNFRDINISSTQTIMPEQGRTYVASVSLNVSDLIDF